MTNNTSSIQKVDNGYIVAHHHLDRVRIFPTIREALQQVLSNLEGLSPEYIDEFGEILIATKPGEQLVAAKPTDRKPF